MYILYHSSGNLFCEHFCCFSSVKFPLLLSQVWHQISMQTHLLAKQTRETCAISLHMPTASSRLHYLDYSESAVHPKAQTTRPHMQDKTHSWGLLEWALRQWQMIYCWVHRKALYNQEWVKTKKKAHLRGAPSAISMAVIPKDQISLCKIHKGPGQPPSFIWSHSIVLTNKCSAVVTL